MSDSCTNEEDFDFVSGFIGLVCGAGAILALVAAARWGRWRGKKSLPSPELPGIWITVKRMFGGRFRLEIERTGV